jgi:SPX domain protein involved in polyphosphate accumulation
MKPAAAPVLERYEMKYTIPMEQMPGIVDFLAPYCQPDKYSENSPDGFYQVNSLYMDSPEFIFLRRRLDGSENRFNMRVRSYGPKPVLPYFLEIKHKLGDIVRKYRARIQDESLERILAPDTDVTKDLTDSREADNAVLFRRLVHTYNAAPVVMTSYRRMAFFSNCDDYARVTFDVGLRFMPQQEYRPLDVSELLAPSDMETVFDDRCSVVLELKCYSKQVPLWMVDLVRTFDLKRRGFSKYSAALAQVFSRHEFDESHRVSPFAGFAKSK